MKKGIMFKSVALIGGGLLLCACASQQSAPEEDNMLVEVNFAEMHLCSRISPEIKVLDAPKGTKYYDVRLMEEGVVPRYLGGGSWQEDGTGIIPEGALTRHYTGPCPKANQKTEFVYIVSAMEDPQGQPLEVRLHRFIPE